LFAKEISWENEIKHLCLLNRNKKYQDTSYSSTHETCLSESHSTLLLFSKEVEPFWLQNELKSVCIALKEIDIAIPDG